MNLLHYIKNSRLFMIMALFIVALTAAAQEVVVSMNDISIRPGETKKVSISVTNDVAVGTSFGGDIFLPKGLTILPTSDGHYFTRTTRTSTKSHSLTDASKEENPNLADNQYRFSLSSSSGKTFTGYSGAVLTFEVLADADLADGASTIELKDCIVAESAFKQHNGDCSSKVTNQGEATAQIKLSAADFTINAGSQTTLNFNFSNSLNIQGVNATIVLPKELKPVFDSEGFCVSFNESRMSYDKFDTGEYYDESTNTITLFLAGAKSNQNIVGSMGKLFSIKVKADSQAMGKTSITIKDVQASSLNGTCYDVKAFDVYVNIVNKHTITFDTDGGSAVAAITQNYGTAIKAPADPTKTGYTFKGWEPAIPATMPNYDMTIKALWEVNKFTVKFVNEDGTELQSSEVAYGETPVYTGETPAKEATAQYSYTFAGWTPEVVAVVADATYTATFESSVNKYNVKFVNEDGTVLKSIEVAYGEMPEYTGVTPSKAHTAEFMYIFAGWTPELAAVTGDATYTATYTSVVNKYFIKFVNEDGTVLYTCEIPYGETPVYEGETPVKEGTAQYSYTFAGWTPKLAPVKAEMTYTATYECTVNTYTVKFVNEDGTELQSSEVAYGETPVYTGETPAKEATAEFTYAFAGWTPEVVAVVADATYTATFVNTTNKYTVKFVNEDGTVLQTAEVAYGETPVYNGETPAKAATAQYTYTFAGWTPEVVAVVANATYTATFESTVNKYTVKFVNYDGTVLQTSEVAYGETPAYNGETPAREANAEFTFYFAGWTPEVVAVVADATYTAIYSKLVNKYTVKFVNEDGTVLQTSEVAYGETPEYKGKTPTKAATAEYSYTFAGWTPEVVAVVADATYTATYSSTLNHYSLTYMVDNEVYKVVDYAYGETITPEAAPEKEGYIFSGWSEIPATMPAHDVTVTGSFAVDGISNIEMNDDTTSIYTISGTRVNATHKGGLYIVNGKKVIKK